MKLSEWMAEEELDQVRAETKLGVDQTIISRILSGKGCSDKTKLKIFNATDGKVTPNDLLGTTAE